jgi:hypothetical protein
MFIKTILLSLTINLLAMSSLTAIALNGMNDIVGVVLSNRDGMLSISDEDEPDFEVLCLVNETDAYDLLTGLPADPGSISEGAYVRVFGSDSRPVVWINCWEEGAAAFKATVSENIQYADLSCNFLTCDEKYRVTLSGDTVIYDPAVGFISPADIRPGQEMFVWLDMVTASCPAQAYPDQVVLIR